MQRIVINTLPPGPTRATSVPLISTPVLQVCTARPENFSLMPPPPAVSLGRVMLPKLTGLHPVCIVYGPDGVLNLPKFDLPTRASTPFPDPNVLPRPEAEPKNPPVEGFGKLRERSAEERSSPILESILVGKPQPENVDTQPEARSPDYSPATGFQAMPEGEEAVSEGEEAVSEGEEAMSYNSPSSPSYRPCSPTREEDQLVESLIPPPGIKMEPMDSTNPQVLATKPSVTQLQRQLRSRDRKLVRARAFLSSLSHNVHRRILYRKELASLRTEFRDKQLIFDTEIAALRAQLAEMRKEKERMVSTNSQLTAKEIRLSQTIRQLHIDLGRMRHVNRSFAARFAARAQY